MLGRAYSDSLSLKEQKALEASVDVLIDELFEDLREWDETALDFGNTVFAIYLPQRYASRYTPLFLKQFTVCVITVGWKLAQAQPIRLASLTEELAAWAIINRAKVVLEVSSELIDSSFNEFIDAYFEDTDFLYLYDNKYDGIDETALRDIMGLPSLKLQDWSKPYRDGIDINSTIHPYLKVEEDETAQRE